MGFPLDLEEMVLAFFFFYFATFDFPCSRIWEPFGLAFTWHDTHDYSK